MSNEKYNNQDVRILHRVGSIQYSEAPPEGVKISIGVIVDTETTGSNVLADKLVELGMVKFEFDANTGIVYRVLDRFCAFDDPGIPILPEATKVNGISDEMVRDCRIVDAEVEKFMLDADLIVAHKANFDRPIVEARFGCFTDKSWACSLEQIDWASEGFGTAKLDYLVMKFGFFYDAHRAENDCLALLQVLRQSLPESGNLAMKCLIDKSHERSYKVSAEKAPFEMKDLLKGKSFKWDDKAKVWHITVSGSDQIKSVVDFLREEIYQNRAVSLPFEIFDAKTLFSLRDGHKTRRSIVKDEQPAQLTLQS